MSSGNWVTAVLLGTLIAAPLLAETLEGRVVEDHSNSALASAEVRVTKPGASGLVADLETDSEGRFRASDLPVGDYRVEVSKPNYVAVTLRLRLPATVSAGLLVRLVRLGVIAGQVTGADGRPVRGGLVFAMVKSAEGVPLRSLGNSVMVDDTGKYRLRNLPPGQYAVALSYATFNPGGGPGVYYYPSNVRPQFFTVSGGEEYRGVDFIISPTQSYSVSGKVAELAAGARFALSLFPVDQPAIAAANTWTASDGSFRLEGIPPGSYDLVVSGPATGYGALESILGPDPVFGRTRVEVGGADIEDLSIAVSKGRSVVFVLHAPGGQRPASPCPQTATVSLSSLEALGSAERRTVEVTSGREQTLENVSPGRYQVAVSKLGEGCYSVSNPVFDLSAGDPAAPVEIVIAPAASIHGRLNTASAKPTDFAVVLLASDYGEGTQPVQVAYPDSQSNFSFSGLRPGRYRIAAQPATEAAGARWVPDLARMFEIDVLAGSPTEVDLSPLPAADKDRP